MLPDYTAGDIPIPLHANDPVVYDRRAAADRHGVVIYIDTHEQSLRQNSYQTDKEPFAVSVKQFFAGAEDKEYSSGGKAGRYKPGGPQKMLGVCGENAHDFHKQG